MKGNRRRGIFGMKGTASEVLKNIQFIKNNVKVDVVASFNQDDPTKESVDWTLKMREGDVVVR
jgi:hypothetical protein